MKNISDNNGRALEYAIAPNPLAKYKGKIKLNRTASIKDQEKDQSIYETLSEAQKNHFTKVHVL